MPFRMSSLTVLVVLAASGSSESVAAQLPGATPSSTSVSRDPRFHPNREKYSDAGARPATGRSGSASLESRALLAKDGMTLVEATTGSLEDGTAPGSIRKMQMKVFSANRTSPFVQNYDGVSGTGYWSTSLQALGRNEHIQLQANIGGIDGNRTDVVTVTAQVKRRPDIAITAVTVPARALAGTRVNVAATVVEKNGDVGARATCVLTIDGTVVDQASGIWVDAGHAVSCAFQTSIGLVGVHQVGVYATGVSPLDWDPTNNSASSSIEILSPETAMSYSVTFDAADYDYQTHYRNSNSDGSYVDEKTETGTIQNRTLSMSSWTSAEAFTFPVQVHTMLSTAGSAVFDVTKQIAYQADESWPGGDCGNLFESGFYIGVCNYHYGTVQRSQIDVSSYDGRVTYFGTRSYQNSGWAGYAYNYSGDYSRGVGGYPIGSDMRPIVELSDARGAMFAARPTMQIQPSPIHSDWGSCYRNPRNDVTYCSDGKTDGTRRSGRASADVP